MGRVSREQAELNRERVVEAACRLFRKHGVENVSIADVMGEVGLTPGGFYKHFASKEALVDEAFQLAFDQASLSWEDTRKRHASKTGDGLEALVRHYFKPRARERSCPMLAFASQVSHSPAQTHANDVYAKGVQALFAQFREEAMRLPPSGKEAKKLSDADALVLFSAMLGTGLLTRTLGQTAWMRDMQSAVLSALPVSNNAV